MVSQYIEHTNLKPFLTDKAIDKLVDEANEHKFFGICIPPFWVKYASRELKATDLKLITVAGFPMGYHVTEVKMEELLRAIDHGADEVDVVMNISAFKSGLPWVKIEIAKLASFAHASGVILKVIIETAYLSDEEIIVASKICADAGADYIKTSTGMPAIGATEEHVRLIKGHIPSHVGIKASGGIKDYETAMKLIGAGATRIGTSAGVEIVKGERGFL